MLDSELDPDQEALRSVARDFLRASCPVELVRGSGPNGTGAALAAQLWQKIADLGWLGLGLPLQAGGGGAGAGTLCALYGEYGRALVPAPYLEVSVIAGETILRAGSAEQKATLLPDLIAGQLLLIPALVDTDGSCDPADTSTVARRRPGGWTISGVKPMVPFAGSADLFLIPARTGTEPAGGLTLFLLSPALAGVTVTPARNMSGLPLFSVQLQDVSVDGSAVLGAPGRGGEYLAPALVKAKVLRCAEIAGAGERVRDMVVAYAREREQFGGPIGRYQAVQYLCTDLAMAARVTQLLSRQAAWLLDEGDESSTRVTAAIVYGSAAAHRIAHSAHEVFAGLGFMAEHNLHLYTRRLKYWELDLGDGPVHSERLASQLAARDAK